jgi:hypothetical protein
VGVEWSGRREEEGERERGREEGEKREERRDCVWLGIEVEEEEEEEVGGLEGEGGISGEKREEVSWGRVVE